MPDATQLAPPKQRGRKPKYPFASLVVGGGFLWPDANEESLRSAACTYAKRHGIKFSCAVFSMADGVRGLQVWRIA